MPIDIDLIGVAQKATATTPTVTFGGTVGSGNGAVVLLSWQTRNASSMVDDQGNSFTLVRVNSFAGVLGSAIWYSPDSSGATSVTITFSAATQYTAQAISVVGNLSLHAGNSRAGNLSTQTANTFNTSVADTIVFATDFTSNFPTLPGGYTGLYSDISTQFCYQVLTATVTGFTATWAVGASSPFGACVEAFESSETTGIVNAHVTDLVLWSGLFIAEKQDVLFWNDAFTFQPPVPVDVSLADTLTWSNLFVNDLSLNDTLTWTASEFVLIESYGPVGETLTWEDSFAPDVNLLAFARYRR